MKGICRLTGEHGKFIRSHIIPAALTRPSVKGGHFIQHGDGERPIRRWTSWYDGQMVTEAGEAILTEIDTAGIAELRRHRLIWSSWGPMIALPESRVPNASGAPQHMRHVAGCDSGRLRLFFLSVLWRAAATTLREFQHITLQKADLARLGAMLRDRRVEPFGFFPMSLFQISTLGFRHNRTPLAEEMYYPVIDDGDEGFHGKTFRFFIDGLIVIFHLTIPPDSEHLLDSPIFVGGSDHLLFMCAPYEHSRQGVDLEQAVANLPKEMLQGR